MHTLSCRRQALHNDMLHFRNSGSDPTLTLEELKGFIEEVENLPCTIPEYHDLKVNLQVLTMLMVRAVMSSTGL